MSSFLPTDILVLGVVVGLLYALLAMGFVLVYKSTRVLNMAHGDIGGFGTVLLVYLALDHGLGFWPSFLVAVVMGALVGALIEARFISRLAGAPRVVVLVATLGLAQLILAANQIIVSPAQQAQLLGSAAFPEPLPWTIHVAGATLRPSALLTIVLVPAIGLALAAFLRLTRFGTAMRAVAENEDNARLLGVSARRVSRAAWALGGGLSATAAVLIGATTGSASNLGIGAPLLVRALAPAMAAALLSLPKAAAWGVCLGVVEQALLFNTQNSGVVDAVLLAFILAALLLQRRPRGRAAELDESSWPIASSLRALPAGLAADPLRQRLRVAMLLAMAVLVVGAPLVASETTTVLLVRVIAFGIAGISLTVLTGYGGQVSLGQWAVAGVGGIAAARIDVAHGWPVWATIVVSAVAGAVVSVLIGLPALRLRGLLLAVTTLAFAVAASGYLFGADWFAGDDAGITVVRPAVIASDRALYVVAIGVLGLAALIAHRTATGRLGRLIAAVRENERSAVAAGIDVVGVKLTTFAIAGAIAGLGGWLAVYSDGIGSRGVFDPRFSLLLVMAAVLGGVGTISGPVVGAFLVFGLPALFPEEAFIATFGTGIGVLNVLLFLPAGVASLPMKIRDALLGGLGRPDPALEPASERGVTDALFEAQSVSVSYGGIRAVHEMSIDVRAGELVGLIGPNGAGKTTLLEVLGGFVRPDHGVVRLAGTDITHLAPHRRARLGIGRGFQDARLYPNVTVEDAIRIGLDQLVHSSSDLAGMLLGLRSARRAERFLADRADALVERFGLSRYARSTIAELSTGTRRVVELATVFGCGSRVVLLDEPTAGVAHAETEALRQLLAGLAADTGAAVVLIEHDVPMVMALADRVFVMASGALLASGTPDEIMGDASVIEAYFGTAPA